MATRDEFRQSTKEELARRVAYHCSKPGCDQPTLGPIPDGDGWINVGVAAHITAAAIGGPRYDPSLTLEERRHSKNGIWLCQKCAKLIDSAPDRFTVELLRKWKQETEDRAFVEISTTPRLDRQTKFTVELDEADRKLIRDLGLPTQDDIDAVTKSLRAAAQADIEAFRSIREFPDHAIPLKFRYIHVEAGNSVAHPVTLAGLAAAIEILDGISLVATPGTGKTTTLVQVADAILASQASIALLVPLAEWSSQPEGIFQSLTRRNAFQAFREQHFMLLAVHGRLVLLLDGWNELDSDSRPRAVQELKRLRRDFPLLSIAISTRRQSRISPQLGPEIEIEALSEEQQLEIARALRGDEGAALLDHAWRTPGVGDLVCNPLYLNTLLAYGTSGTMPTTKDEVLQLFVTKHEKSPDKAEVLERELFGHHRDMLVALAAEAPYAETTFIQDNQARKAICRVEDQLVEEGQITTRPQPATVLDVLVNLHVLIRSTSNSGVSFQHQTFQEW